MLLGYVREPAGVTPGHRALKHDHVDILLDSGRCFDIETGGSDRSLSHSAQPPFARQTARSRSQMIFRWIT